MVDRIEHIQRPFPFLPPLPQQKPLLPDSSVSVAAPQLSYKPSKPVLEQPVWRMLRQQMALETLGDQFVDLSQIEIDAHLGRMCKIERAEAEKMHESILRTQDVTFWSYLRDLGSMLLSAFSWIIGYSALPTAPVLGGILIAAGVLSLLNFTFRESGVWDWFAGQIANEDETLRKQLAEYIPAAIGLLTALVSFAGTAGLSWYSQLDLTQKLITIAQTATSLTTGAANLGQGIAHYKLSHVESALMLTRWESSRERHLLENAMTEMQAVCQNQSQIAEEASDIVTAVEESTKLIINQSV